MRCNRLHFQRERITGVRGQTSSGDGIKWRLFHIVVKTNLPVPDIAKQQPYACFPNCFNKIFKWSVKELSDLNLQKVDFILKL